MNVFYRSLEKFLNYWKQSLKALTINRILKIQLEFFFSYPSFKQNMLIILIILFFNS